MPHLEIAELLLLVHCNFVNNYYQHNARVSYTFVINKLFGQLLDILSKNVYIFNKTYNSEFLYIEKWFTDQCSKPLETEDKINITLIIN